jgi:hypothetical protein
MGWDDLQQVRTPLVVFGLCGWVLRWVDSEVGGVGLGANRTKVLEHMRYFGNEKRAYLEGLMVGNRTVENANIARK